MHRMSFFSLPTSFSFRSVQIVKCINKGIPKQVILYNKEIALTKQIRLGRMQLSNSCIAVPLFEHWSACKKNPLALFWAVNLRFL